jgi:hypothetical protein
MHDRVFAVHEFGPELDRMPREGPPGENAAPDAIPGLNADRREPGTHQLAHRKHAGRPGPDDDDVSPNRQRARTTWTRLGRLAHNEGVEATMAFRRLAIGPS